MRTICGGVVVGLALLPLLLLIVRKAREKLPPGPKGLPLLGIIHKLPPKFQERAFHEWSKKYGDIIYFKVLQTPTIVLNSIEAARDLLDKRNSKYSDRPRSVYHGELLGEEASLTALSYGDRFRRHRRWLYDSVGNKEKLRSLRYLQRREVRKLMRNLLNDPEPFMDHLHLCLASLLLELTYGKKVNSLQDELVEAAEHGMQVADGAGHPGALIVNYFPLLKHIPNWFPGAGFKVNAMAARKVMDKWMDSGYNAVMADLAAGTAGPSLLADVAADIGNSPTPTDIVDMKGLSLNGYGAGVDTSRSTLGIFFLTMTRNPHVYRKAQEEMDRVVGHDRLPDYSDRESLPYLNALLEEVLRWNPPIPTGVPHRVTTDDEYRGYHIPAGCTIIFNAWAMTRDTRYFLDPEEFRPERHLETDSDKATGLRGDRLLPSSIVFGFGRRVCPGQAFADGTVWLAMAHVVALFDIGKAVDASGNEINPPAAFTSGFTSGPAPFLCKITPRSDKTAALLSVDDFEERCQACLR
ncbi:cytochrome P450 [Trametes elegans]|nr:cytochrome P450 [Trametes elegans]